MRINRRPDRRWFGTIYNTVVARDGSLAVASGVRGEDGERPEQWALSVLQPDGKGRSVAFLPDSIDSRTFAFDGRRIVAWDEGRLRILDPAGKTLALLGVPKDIQSVRKMPILLSRSGSEAWILDGGRRVFHRVQLP